uniref:Uncharacterized protein n=1 Tax=Romanomermis culicivorax TaxID=13658 RepID=A0A915KSD8_ROMCU
MKFKLEAFSTEREALLKPSGAGAIPPLANVGVGVTIPTNAQQQWPGSEPVDWLQRQSYGVSGNLENLEKSGNFDLDCYDVSKIDLSSVVSTKFIKSG